MKKINKNYLLITSGIITLSLLNASHVQAEKTDNLNIADTKSNSVQNIEKTTPKSSIDDENIQIEDIEKTSNNQHIKFNETIEKLNSLFDEKNKEILDTIISHENINFNLFSEAILLHEAEEFEQARVLYKQLLQKENIVGEWKGFIQLLLKASGRSVTLFEIDYQNAEVDEEHHDLEDEKVDNDIERVESTESSDNLLDDYSDDFEDDGSQETTNDEIETIDKLTVRAQFTADELYDSIINAKYAFEAWEAVLEFELLYPMDLRLQESIDIAANYMLNQGIKSHSNKNYTQATEIYQKLLSHSKINPKLYNVIQSLNEQSSKSNSIRQANDLYASIMEAQFAYQAWEDAIYFKVVYPNDPRLTESINQAAGYILNQSIKSHERKDYNQAVYGYSKILNEKFVREEIRNKTTIYYDLAIKSQKILTATDLYNSVMNAQYAYQAWEDALLLERLYPNDSRVDEAINKAAGYLLNQGVKKHLGKDFDQAILTYNKILSNNSINHYLYETVSVYLNQANKGQSLVTADDLYNSVQNAEFASVAWEEALYMKEAFPSDSRLQKTIDKAANYILSQGVKSHQRKEFNKAEEIYSKILAQNSVSIEIYEKAQSYSRQAKNNQELVKASDLYNSIMNAKYAYQAWDEAQLMKEYFSNDLYTEKAINQAAEYMLNQGIKSHRNKDFNKAKEIYQKITAEKLVNITISEAAQTYLNQALNNKEILTAFDLYNSIVHARYAYEAWDVAQIFKKSFPNDELFRESMDTAATYILNQAIKNHSQNKYQSAMDSYAQIYKEVFVSNNIRVRAESYHYLASNNYSLSNIILRQTNYNISINDFLSVQMTRNPQIWDASTNSKDLWRNATRSETERYVNPLRVNHNEEYLQFLMLSGSSGISANDLNKELSNAGILRGLGKVFLKASEEANVNELYLIAHALLETGHGTSNLATGIKVNGKTVYNMFGIGAIDKNADKYGSEKAYEMGWFTPEDAIIGGAKWISESYINNQNYKQDTLYKMRWNPSMPGTHQYATDVAWAYNQTATLDSLVELAQKYNTLLNFDIPVFK